MVTIMKKFLSSLQVPPLRAALQHPVPRTPQQPLTTCGPVPCMDSLPNFTVSTAPHAASLLAISHCHRWHTPLLRPLPLLHLSLATQWGAPTPRRCFLPSCTPHLLLPVLGPKVQSRPGPPCCSGCSQRRSWDHQCCLLHLHPRRHLLL